MSEHGEGPPIQEKVNLSAAEREKLRVIEKESQESDFNTKGLLDHFREREKPSTSRVEQIKDLIEFLNARKDDSPNKDEKRRLDRMRKLASELVDEKDVQANKGRFVSMKRYVIEQKKHFTDAEQDTIDSLQDIIPEPYPTDHLDPKKAVTELQKGDVSVDGIDKFLKKATQDNIEMQEETQLQAFRAAVNAAVEFKNQYKEDEYNNRVIGVGIKNGKVERNPNWSSESAAEVKPENGVFAFAPETDEEDPLSLNRAADSVDKIFRDIPNMLKRAKIALEKIKKGNNDDRPTDDEGLALVRTLEMHQEYFTQKAKGNDKPKTVDTLGKMIELVLKKMGKPTQAEREQEIDETDVMGARGAPAQEMPQGLQALARMFGGINPN